MDYVYHGGRMANRFQKVIYNLSATVPLCFSFSVVWYLQKHTYFVPLIFLVIGILLTLFMNLSFSYVRKNLAPIQIRTNDISPNDGWIIAYIILYILFESFIELLFHSQLASAEDSFCSNESTLFTSKRVLFHADSGKHAQQ